MSNSLLFESCNKKPELFINNFHHTFNDIICMELETKLEVSVGPNVYNKVHILEDIEVLIRLIKSRWFCVQDVVLNNQVSKLSTIESSREIINQGFQGIISSLLLCEDLPRKEKWVEETLRLVKEFSTAVIPLNKIKEVVLLKIPSNNKSCPYYQYLHCFIEVQYYLIVLYYVCGLSAELLEEKFTHIMKNTYLLSKTNFHKSNIINMCNCIKYFWLIFQLILEKVDVTGVLFWKLFNHVLNSETPIVALNMLREIAFIQCINTYFEDVGLKCERIKPNYEFLEVKLKELLNVTDCNTLAHGFKVIEPLLCKLWLKESKIDVYQTIWDFYSKRLNVSNRSSNNISALQFIEALDTILEHPSDCHEDFEIFVGLLVFHLREYPMQWGKMKGRIYSQIGPNKIKDLSDIGVRHVLVLFFALSTINFKELEKKMISFLENSPQDKKFSILVWNFYTALILKYVREGRSIEKLATPMIHMLQEASVNKKMHHLLKEFINNLEHVIEFSSNMQLQQWLLFGSWFNKYQSVCYFSDLKKSLDVVLLLLDRCGDADSLPLWELCFKENVYPTLKQLAPLSSAPATIGKIAGKLALLYVNLSSEAFSFFNSEPISPKISSDFLEVILHRYPDNLIITPQQEAIIVKSWVKICLLTTDSQSSLTKNVIKLDIFPVTLKHALKSSSDSFYAFIEYLGNICKELSTIPNDVIKISDLAFGDLDKTLAQYLLRPDSEEVVLKFYQYITLAFLNCGSLLYSKNKPSSPLTKLVTTLLLPMDFLVGKKSPHNYVLNAIRKTWHKFFEAFVVLNKNHDPYLDRTLKDMIVKYMAFFPTSDSPIVSSIENPMLTEIILDKIYVSYFKPPYKEIDANLLKALKVISDLINSTTSISLYKLVITKTLYGLFEVVIFHSQRSAAIGTIKTIISSPLYSQHISEFRTVVLEVNEKYLGLNTINCFQLLICLAKFTPSNIKSMIGDIKLQVTNVERLRGVGFDTTLRLHLEKLENALQDT